MWFLRARCPSKKSVKLAAAKTMPATRYQALLKLGVPYCPRAAKIINTGTRAMRARVSLLGRFIAFPPLPDERTGQRRRCRRPARCKSRPPAAGRRGNPHRPPRRSPARPPWSGRRTGRSPHPAVADHLKQRSVVAACFSAITAAWISMMRSARCSRSSWGSCSIRAARRALLLRVGKAAQAVEPGLLDKGAQLVELRLRLAGIARDQGGAQVSPAPRRAAAEWRRGRSPGRPCGSSSAGCRC